MDFEIYCEEINQELFRIRRIAQLVYAIIEGLYIKATKKMEGKPIL